jgi:hypothetical protein
MIAEHRETPDGFCFGRLVLENVPVLGELAVLKANDISRNPHCRTTVPGETPVRNHVVALGDDKLVFVAKLFWKTADGIEPSVTP